MHDPRINTYAAIIIIAAFSIAAVFLVLRAIDRVDWTYQQAYQVFSIS